MFKATVLYKQPTNPDAFEDYYFASHMPIAAAVPHVARVETARAAQNPDGSQPVVYRTAELWFDDQESMQAALGSPEGQAAVADCQTFATGGFDIFISVVD